MREIADSMLPSLPRAALTASSLDYLYAFDQCLVQARGSVLVAASNPYFAAELTNRFDGAAAVAAVGDWWQRAAPETRAALWALEYRDVQVQALAVVQGEFDTLIWAASSLDNIPLHLLRPGGRLIFMVGGLLYRFLPPFAQEDYWTDRPLPSIQAVSQWVRQHQAGSIQAQHGFHGVVSIVWSYAYRAANTIGREDWAARCWHASRASFTVTGAFSPLATTAIIVVEKQGGAR